MFDLYLKNTGRFFVLAITLILALTVLSFRLIYGNSDISLKLTYNALTFTLTIIITTCVIYIGQRFKYSKIKLVNIYKSVLFASSIFILQYLFEFIWLLANKKYYQGSLRSNFSSLSIYHIYQNTEVPAFLMYPLQTLNIWEFIHVFLLMFAYQRITESNKNPYFNSIIAITYISALLVYFLITIFINLSLSL
jgi:hypothetical protein